MPEVRPNVMLIRYTPAPEELVAMAGKLCYSPSTLDDLAEGVAEHDQTKYLKKLTDMGHMSPIEHASFTFGIEGVSRSLLAQITRHRIASFSVQSQRYVGQRHDCYRRRDPGYPHHHSQRPCPDSQHLPAL